MTLPSLGQRMREQARATFDCEQALERKAATLGPCAQMDLILVRAFFQQACVDFASAILAGIAPPVIAIGNGRNDKVAAILQTYRWNDNHDIRTPDHPYHGLWRPFLAWCTANELEPGFACKRDASGKERWYALAVRSCPHLDGPEASLTRSR